MKEVVIVSAMRTPIGSFMGELSKVPAPKLGAVAIEAALKKINLPPSAVNEVIMGNVLQANTGQAPARQAAILANIPDTVPCTTINKVCASGLKAVMQAAQAIALGDATIIVAGGMENMSLTPHYIHSRTATKFGSKTIIDGIQKDGLVDAYSKEAMGVYADACATKHSISRQEQDRYAIQSYNRSSAAWENKLFNNEVTPIAVPQRRGEPKIVNQDEEFSNIITDKVPLLKPAFTKEGSATAANSSTINDGAAALVLMSKEKAQELNMKPLATIKSYADAAQEPERFTTAPAKALPIALKKANLTIDSIDYFEINEAFSVVGLANIKLLGIKENKVNINGGAVSLGHPLGCSGARILTTLINVLEQKDAKLGAAAICNGGGGASAIIIERE